ncbi:MAG TPA: hypothetical protein VHW69_18175 [Rhizomicrobium sp.]|nr:hypothetical protein [Rhizomicrobium sp.]
MTGLFFAQGIFCTAAWTREKAYTSEFLGEDSFTTLGNNYFPPTTPGLFQVLESPNGKTKVTVTVRNRTKKVAGVETRVVTEDEEKNGIVTETTDNYEAVSTKTGTIYYFGEYATQYKDGQAVGHKGSWLAGENGATFRMLLPGVALIGARFQQENAGPIALDPSEIIKDNVSVTLPAGSFTGCLKVFDTDGLDPEAPPENKIYCPGIGNVVDETLVLTQYGQH